MGWMGDYPGEQWRAIAERSENRSMVATLERRFLFPDCPDNRKIFPDYNPKGVVGMLISPPEVFARIES